jgi:tetraspanin-11
VFVIGLITLVDRNFLSELLGTNLFSGAVYVLVITSALVCLLSFFGCFGAVKEIKCMLLTVSEIPADICFKPFEKIF